MLALARFSLRFGTVFALAIALTSACGSDGGDGDGDGIAEACNPLGGVHCMMPWPSSTYLTTDSSTDTGFRLDIPIEATPVNQDGKIVDPGPWNARDGFSPTGALIAAFPNGVSGTGLPGYDDLAASVDANSPILIIDIATGERPTFFAEPDGNASPDKAALLIRPMVRLKPATRYAVAIRDTVLASDGSALTRPEAFQAILDGASFDHPRFDALAAGYADIFAAVEAHGVARDELVLAWEFVTASNRSLQEDMLTMRDLALPEIGTNGANLTFNIEEFGNPGANVHRLYRGTHDAPNFLDDGESDDSIIVRGADGLPTLDGTYSANFAAVIPECVNTATLPVPVIVFGHGVFGNAEEYVGDDLLQDIAQQKCFVIIGGDFIGLTDRQLVGAANASNDLNRSHSMVEKLAQSVINFIALEQLVRGPLAASPEFALNGTPIIDTANIWYLGGSLGGTMGGTFMAYDPGIELGVLGVAGGNWNLFLERSAAWSPLQIAAQGAYPDPYDYDMLVALLTFSMERWDPITTAHNVFDDPLGVPVKQLLYYEGVNDSLINNIATEYMARELGLPVTGPTVRMPYGFVEETAPMTSSLAIYDEGVEIPTTNNVPPLSDNGTHSGVNKRQAVIDQMEHFFRQREVINTCGDQTPVPCDCTTGACGERL